MHTLSHAVHDHEPHGPPSHEREDSRRRDLIPAGRTYCGGMPAVAPGVRKLAFSRFVRRGVDGAKQSRGWTVEDIANATKQRAAQGEGRKAVSRATIYRWLSGDWEEAPSGDLVEAFCDVLDIPAAAGLAVLWPGKTGRAAAPEPPPLDEDFELLLRRLQDPNVPEREKWHIRETIRTLATRPAPRERPTGS